jgi:hypothetical protein
LQRLIPMASQFAAQLESPRSVSVYSPRPVSAHSPRAAVTAAYYPQAPQAKATMTMAHQAQAQEPPPSPRIQAPQASHAAAVKVHFHAVEKSDPKESPATGNFETGKFEQAAAATAAHVVGAVAHAKAAAYASL